MRQSPPRCAPSVFLLAVIASFTIGKPHFAVAQVTRTTNESFQQQRGQYVDGVLKTLVNNRRNFSRPVTALPAEQISPQVQETARYLKAFADETQQLITELRYEERFSTGVRALLGEAINVKATAEMLVSRSTGISEPAQMAQEYSALDKQWRLLAYHLENTPNLSNNVRERVKRLNRGNEAIEKQLKLTPQISHSQLIYLFTALGEDLDHLREDVRLDLYTHPQRDEFSRKLEQMRARTQQLRLANEYKYPHADIVNYYKQFHDEWLAVKGQMRTIQNRHIQRNISRITQVNDQIHEQLWIQPVIDGQDILYQATALQQQVQGTAEQITMRQLIEQPNARDIFAKSQEFYAICNRFRNTVETESQLDGVKWDFRELDVAWTDLKAIMNPLQTNDTIQNVATIENTVSGLRHALGLDAGYTQQSESYDLALKLNNMSELLARDVNRFTGTGQFSGQFRDEAVHFANQFQQTARQFQTSIYQRAEAPQLRQESRALAQKWNDLQNVLAKIPYQQRGEVMRSTEQIGPIMAKLQLLYAY